MKKSAKQIISIAILFILVFLIWIFLGPQPYTFHLAKVDLDVIENLKSFTEDGANNNIDASQITKKYESVRLATLSKATSRISQRNTLIVLSNVLCVLSIIASFIISFLGANTGAFIKSETLDSSLDKLEGSKLKLKKQLITLSACAILSTTLSNRLSSYADKAQSTAYEIIDLIKASDTKISSAININEVNNITKSFELDASKY